MGVDKYDRNYNEKYNKYEYAPIGRALNRARWGLVTRFVPPYCSILDWGCGNGAFVRNAPEGIVAVGYDINPYSGYNHGAVEYLDSDWEGVTLFDVLEHMELPYEFLRRLRTRMVFICTPDLAGAKDGIEKWKHFRPDEHQHYFTVASLARILDRSGFDVIHLDRQEALIRDANEPCSLVTIVGRKK